MKKYIILLFTLTFCLSSCSNNFNSGSKDKATTNNYDNSSFYDSFNHNIVETDQGYYNLYNQLLLFIDKETYKDYLVTKEKNSLEDLLANEELKIKSDAYFEGASDVFYEDKNIYLTSENKVWIVDENNYTKEEHTIDFNINRVVYKGSVYYLKLESDPSKTDELELKSFNPDTGEASVLCKLKPELENMGFNIDSADFNINKLFARNNQIYILANINSALSKKIVIAVNIADKSINVMDEKVDGYQLIGFYIHNDEPVFVYNATSTENPISWAESPWLVKVNGDIEETGLLKTKIYSDNGTILTSFPGLATYKAFKIKENGIEDTEYTITIDGKDVIVDDSLLQNLQIPYPKLTNDGVVLFSYGDGALSIIKDGVIHEIIK